MDNIVQSLRCICTITALFHSIQINVFPHKSTTCVNIHNCLQALKTNWTSNKYGPQPESQKLHEVYRLFGSPVQYSQLVTSNGANEGILCEILVNKGCKPESYYRWWLQKKKYTWWWSSSQVENFLTGLLRVGQWQKMRHDPFFSSFWQDWTTATRKGFTTEISRLVSMTEIVGELMISSTCPWCLNIFGFKFQTISF